MSIPGHLMEKFFRGDCTADETQEVTAWLRDNPEELAQYLTESSWEEFSADARQDVPTEKIRRTIEATVGEMSAPVRKIRYSWVAAASIIAAVALFFTLHKNTGPATQPIAATTPALSQHQSYLKIIENTSSRTKAFYLPDGSRLELSGKTTVSYDSAFVNGRRDIFLQQGEAIFTVKKDPRPFTVHSKGITTTALGTVFSVSDKQRSFTTVHLFSGKIVIKKAAGETPGASFKDIYLKPGQQLVLNKENFSVQIKNITAPAAASVPSVDRIATAPQQRVLDFTIRPLTEILSLLQQEYNVSIAYDPATLQNMTFTGKLNRDKESLESFLSTLCDLNDLSLKKINDNSFAIQQKQP